MGAHVFVYVGSCAGGGWELKEEINFHCSPALLIGAGSLSQTQNSLTPLVYFPACVGVPVDWNYRQETMPTLCLCGLYESQFDFMVSAVSQPQEFLLEME